MTFRPNQSAHFAAFAAVVAFLTAQAGVASDSSTHASRRSYAAEIETSMGDIQLNGLPKLRYSLCESKSLRVLALRCDLIHTVEVDAYGRPRSVWRLSGLQTTLAPGERRVLVWRRAGSGPVEFDRTRIDRRMTNAGSTKWHIRQIAGDEYEIRALDGRVWRYVEGLLTHMEHPAFGLLAIRTVGASISRVHEPENASMAEPLLDITYDRLARPISLRAGAAAAITLLWSDTGSLLSWTHPDRGPVEFFYRSGLLAAIAEPAKPRRVFSWANNPGYSRGDTRWPAPVHLSSDGENTYEYRLSRRGFVIERHAVADGNKTTIIFNPRLRRLEQQASGKRFVVTLKARGDHAIALERIEDSQGRLLEEYLYDDAGELVGLRRDGETVRD